LENPVHRLLKHSHKFCSLLTANNFFGYENFDNYLLSFINKSNSLLSQLRTFIFHYNNNHFTEENEESAAGKKEKEKKEAAEEKEEENPDHSDNKKISMDLNHIIEFYYFQIIMKKYENVKMEFKNLFSIDTSSSSFQQNYNETQKEAFSTHKQEILKEYLGYELFIHSIYFPTIYYYMNIFPIENLFLFNSELFMKSDHYFQSLPFDAVKLMKEEGTEAGNQGKRRKLKRKKLLEAVKNNTKLFYQENSEQIDGLFTFLNLDYSLNYLVGDQKTENDDNSTESSSSEWRTPSVSYEEAVAFQRSLTLKQKYRQEILLDPNGKEEQQTQEQEEDDEYNETGQKESEEEEKDDELISSFSSASSPQPKNINKNKSHNNCGISQDIYNKLIHFFIPFNIILEQYLHFPIDHWNYEYDEVVPNYRPQQLKSLFTPGYQKNQETLWYEIMDEHYYHKNEQQHNKKHQNKNAFPYQKPPHTGQEKDDGKDAGNTGSNKLVDKLIPQR
jgi:hypothetical protein